MKRGLAFALIALVTGPAATDLSGAQRGLTQTSDDIVALASRLKPGTPVKIRRFEWSVHDNQTTIIRGGEPCETPDADPHVRWCGRGCKALSRLTWQRGQDMRSLVLLVAVFIMVVGMAGVLTPDSLITVGRYLVTPVGLYAVAALRVGIGLVLMLVARISRAPKTLRAFGGVALVGGLTTPLFGVERARAIVDWEAAQGTALIRVWAGLTLAIGGFIAFAVAAGRRPA